MSVAQAVFLRTRLATDFAEPTGWRRSLSTETANRGYRSKFHLVRSGLIEFDAEGRPNREIALEASDGIVFAGPSAEDDGFWLDTVMRRADVAGEEVAEAYFERLWAMSGVDDRE